MDEIVDINTLFGPLPLASNDLTVESLLELMHQHQVSAACTLSTLGLLLDSTVGNTVTRATCTENPSLLPVATANPTMYFGDRDPLLRARSEGFQMLRFFPAMQGWPIDFAPFATLVNDARETGLPVMVNISTPGDITVLARTLEGYPAPVILAEVTPGLLSEALAVLRTRETWHLELSRLLAPGCMKMVVDTIGASRLLFGTNAPAHPIASALDTLHYAGLSPADTTLILGANARRLLNPPA